MDVSSSSERAGLRTGRPFLRGYIVDGLKQAKTDFAVLPALQVCSSLVCGTRSPATAGIISFNLFAGNSRNTIAPADAAGAPGVRTTNWNQLSSAERSLDAGRIKDDSGRLIPAMTVTLTPGGSFLDRAAGVTNDNKMINTFVDKYDGSPGILTVSNVLGQQLPTVLCLLTALLFFKASSLLAAEWQWSVPVTSVTSDETGDYPRAFLWVPPDCGRVRAVVVGQHNMQEEPILEHPAFRAAMSDMDVAAVWVTPPFNPFFRFDQGAGEQFEEMMKALADESGYSELEFAPVVPLGHSAMASFPWSFAIWNPARTLAGISVSGQWPYLKESFRPDYGARTIDGIPAFVCLGEYEWAEERADEGLKERSEHPQTPLSMLAEPGGGHFEASDERIEYLALYLKKAVEHRLPADAPLKGPVQLKSIDPTRQGWLAERWRLNTAPSVPAAPVNEYTGDPAEAFWYFDEELARETEAFQGKFRGRKTALVGYVQEGGIVPQVNGTHQQVTLKFLPQEDGLTFKLTGTFLDTVPEGRPERWTGLKAGSPVDHPESGPIVINRICGPVEKLSADTFAVRFYRMGMNNRKRTPEIWLAASHPGDDEYRHSVQQALMRIPLRHTSGVDQTIIFPEIPDQPVGRQEIKLDAISDAGVPVYYYVREGPAEVEGDVLKLTSIPPRAKFPVEVTVVAWQYGRGTEPRLKSAEPIERTFRMTK